MQRALEIEEGVEPPPGFTPSSAIDTNTLPESPLAAPLAINPAKTTTAPAHWHMLCSNDTALRLMLPNLLHHSEEVPRIHSQVYCLSIKLLFI